MIIILIFPVIFHAVVFHCINGSCLNPRGTGFENEQLSDGKVIKSTTHLAMEYGRTVFVKKNSLAFAFLDTFCKHFKIYVKNIFLVYLAI